MALSRKRSWRTDKRAQDGSLIEYHPLCTSTGAHQSKWDALFVIHQRETRQRKSRWKKKRKEDCEDQQFFADFKAIKSSSGGQSSEAIALNASCPSVWYTQGTTINNPTIKKEIPQQGDAFPISINQQFMKRFRFISLSHSVNNQISRNRLGYRVQFLNELLLVGKYNIL